MSDFSLAGVCLHTPVCLAPMAGVTDRAFRALCLEKGADYLTTEMISAKALCYGDEKTAALAFLGREEHPIAAQLFGAEPETVARACGMIAEGSYHGCRSEILPAAIDLNMGCPMKKITGNGEGSALMRDPLLAGRIIEAAVKATTLPITVKMRTGWDGAHRNAPEIARIAEEAGAAMICVHGRTREQLYRPPIDSETIAAVKAAVKIPVIGNGGIRCGGDALRMLRETGCDGVAVGQGAEGNPWIFAEIVCALRGEEYTPPGREEILRTAMRHAELLIRDKGEYVGVREFRRHLSHYVKGMRGAARLREEICRVTEERTLFRLLTEFLHAEKKEA